MRQQRNGLQMGWKLDKAGVGPADDFWRGCTLGEHSHGKLLGGQAAHDFARVNHLCIRQAFVGERVDQNIGDVQIELLVPPVLEQTRQRHLQLWTGMR